MNNVKLNAVFRHYAGSLPPTIPPGHHGPEILAEILIQQRAENVADHDGDAGWIAPLSDEGVKTLVTLAYYASLMPEEGRFPMFKLVCQVTEGLFALVCQFDDIKLEGVETLRRLAPACTHPECAFLVAESQGAILCKGIHNIGSVGYVWLGSPGLIAYGGPPRMIIEVFGPGHIRVSETNTSHEIRAGNIRRVYTYDAGAGIKTIWHHVHERLKREVLPVIGHEFDLAVNDRRAMLAILLRMLRRATSARHGGAFVFLPPGSSAGDYGLKIRYETSDLDLGKSLVDQWHLFGAVQRERNTANYDSMLRRAESYRSKVMTEAEAVANLSAVDGCVVLTHDLDVLGFGAKILVSDEEAKKSDRLFRHIASDTVYDHEEFLKGIGGTRHQSVARLCQTHPGVIVFTISQDGDLKLFYNDDKHAYAWGPLDLPSLDSDYTTF